MRKARMAIRTVCKGNFNKHLKPINRTKKDWPKIPVCIKERRSHIPARLALPTLNSGEVIEEKKSTQQ